MACSHSDDYAKREKTMLRFYRLAFVSTFLIVAVFAGLADSAGSSESPVAAVNASDDVGLKGYDPVAYFTDEQPIRGTPHYSFQWKGVTYRFASAGNLQRFKADPNKYLPQYGGYCAYAMSINRIADISPTEWTIFGGKLYLNNNFISQTLWSLDKSGRVKSGDRNWAVFPKTAEGK
jgi:YHS domain-containing protein